ncbi:MAG: hypothetical protein ACE5DM_05610 [Candidatus Nanoarchaeia archaeon]
MRVIRTPDYVCFKRWNGAGPVEDGSHPLLMPKILLNNSWSPMHLEHVVYECEWCELNNGTLVTDHAKTEEARRVFYDLSPAVLVMGQLFMKMSFEGAPLYTAVRSGEVIPANSPLDYVCSKAAVLEYCKRARIAKVDEVARALKEGRLHHYELEQIKPVKRRQKRIDKDKEGADGYRGNDFNPLRSRKTKSLQLFLLEEVNALRHR